MSDRAIPVVDYLVLGDEPHLLAHECTGCGALFLDRRSGCGRCGGVTFGARRLSDTGRLRAFTIVHRAPPTVATPFVVGVVDLDGGGTVKANVTDVTPDPDHVTAGMRVRLTTFPVGAAPGGDAVVSFAFAPV